MRSRPIYTGYPKPDFNFTIVTRYKGPPRQMEAAKRDEVYRSAVGTTFADFAKKRNALSEFMGSTLSHVHDVTPDTQINEGDVIVLNRIKSAPRKAQAYGQLMHEVGLPMATDRVRDGGWLRGWSYSYLVFPSGNSLPWDSTVSSVYKDLASAVGAPGAGGGAGRAAAAFAKMFPNRSYTQYLDNLREYGEVVRTDTYAVVFAIRP